MRLTVFAFAAALTLTACPAAKTAAPDASLPPPAAARQLTLLVTGHESGTLPLKAPRLVAQWRAEEKWPEVLAFSTGDSFSGQAISSHFLGASTAEVMKALQYKASALGNHDLDLGLDTFRRFRDDSGMAVLAANLKDKEGSDAPLNLAPSLVVTRDGIKVGVVGLTSQKTIASVVSGRSAGLELLPLERALGAALEGLEKDAPDVVLVLADQCFGDVKQVLSTHRDWRADFVVGSRCEGPQQDVDDTTLYFSIGDDLSAYVSITVTLRPDGTKTLDAKRKALVEQGDEDQDLVALRARWQKKLDDELGQKIGFTRAGYPDGAPQLRTLVATALRDETRADAALINEKAVRAALPKGDITRASVYSLIPFENAVVTVKLKGEVITKLKSHPEAVIVAPPKLDPEKDYTLVTTEYLYFGGDGLGLEVVAPQLELTGQVWQTPVISWLEKQQTSEQKPLEKLLK